MRVEEMQSRIVVRVGILVVGSIVGWMLAKASPQIAGTLGWLVSIACLILLFPSRKSGSLPSRWTVFAVLIVGGVMTGSANDFRNQDIQEQLAEARAESEEAYFTAIKELQGERAWLNALEEEAPALYSAEIQRIENQREQRTLERAQEREKRLVCERVERWLMEEGTRQYQSNAGRNVQVLSVSSGRCEATPGRTGYFNVHIEGIEVALRGRDNPRDLQADALVRVDDPTTETFERAVCRVAWGPFDWAETTAGC